MNAKTPPEPELILDLRQALPDALRVLLADYPRAGWESDPGYDGLIRFWLDRHMMFRRILEKLELETERCLNREIAPDVFARQLSRFGSMLVGELHGHHTIEDQHYFPVLIKKDQRLERGFALLDADHHALDGHLESFVGGANAVLSQKSPAEAAVDAFGKETARLSSLLDRHLVDEEELVVPVILKYGAAGL